MSRRCRSRRSTFDLQMPLSSSKRPMLWVFAWPGMRTPTKTASRCVKQTAETSSMLIGLLSRTWATCPQSQCLVPALLVFPISRHMLRPDCWLVGEERLRYMRFSRNMVPSLGHAGLGAHAQKGRWQTKRPVHQGAAQALPAKHRGSAPHSRGVRTGMSGQTPPQRALRNAGGTMHIFQGKVAGGCAMPLV